MAESSESAISTLICKESADSCFDDIDCNATLEFAQSSSFTKFNDYSHTHNRNLSFDVHVGFESLMSFQLQSEERVRAMLERESEHLPRDDYLNRLRTGELDLSVRREALDWIFKAYAHYNFGPLSICLSLNYLDRFLSIYELPRGKSWVVQLLAVACLSIAVKMEETKVPQFVDMQVGEPNFVFEAKTIQRMELLVLSILKWRMQAITPLSFIDYFLSKISDGQHPSLSSISKSVELILTTSKGIDLMEFRASEIAAAVAVHVSGEIHSLDIDKAMSCLLHVEKGRVLKCIEMIKKELSVINGSFSNGAIALAPSTKPQSPNGVLDVLCLSYKSDELTTVAPSFPNSSHIKKMKPDNHS